MVTKKFEKVEFLVFVTISLITFRIKEPVILFEVMYDLSKLIKKA